MDAAVVASLLLDAIPRTNTVLPRLGANAARLKVSSPRRIPLALGIEAVGA